MSELFLDRAPRPGHRRLVQLTGVAVFGGTAPLVIQALSDAGHASWFFWYVAAGL